MKIKNKRSDKNQNGMVYDALKDRFVRLLSLGKVPAWTAVVKKKLEVNHTRLHSHCHSSSYGQLFQFLRTPKVASPNALSVFENGVRNENFLITLRDFQSGLRTPRSSFQTSFLVLGSVRRPPGLMSAGTTCPVVFFFPKRDRN